MYRNIFNQIRLNRETTKLKCDLPSLANLSTFHDVNFSLPHDSKAAVKANFGVDYTDLESHQGRTFQHHLT